MSDALPSFYTSLGPFQDAFVGKVPILTYHKFGARPRGVRLRGMYLPTELFERQLKEFRDARYRTGPVSSTWEKPDGNRVVLTIDDGFQSVHREALPMLVRAGFEATLYVVVDRLGGWNDWEIQQGEARAPLMTLAELKEWIAAGNRVGAHTLTHPWLTRIPLAKAREEIRGSRRKLEDLVGAEVTDFCYPYGDWSRTIRDEVVEAGFRTATTTDFGWNDSTTDRWGLRRITARHQTRSVRGVRAWWRALWGQKSSAGSTSTAKSRKT